MASNEGLEMYENTKNIVSKKNVRQENEIYENVSDCQDELATEKNTTAKQATSFSSKCKKHVQPILIGVLYALVLIYIFWNLYSDEIRKGSLMNMKSVMENNKKCLEESTSTVDNLKGVINEINTTYMDWFYDLENIKKDLKESTSSVDDLKLVINEIDTRYKERFSDLSGKVADLEKQIKDLKSQTVAFNVIDAVSFTGTDPIKFSRVILNEGNAYNKDTGNFTAPVDGIYQFNAHICCKIDTDVEYEIKVERTVILTGEFRASEGSSDTKCTSFSAAALVRKGENVRVGGMPFSNLDRVGSNDLSSFSGTLIQKL